MQANVLSYGRLVRTRGIRFVLQGNELLAVYWRTLTLPTHVVFEILMHFVIKYVQQEFVSRARSCEASKPDPYP